MTVVKRILILMADAGFGHRTAANAIAAALKETYSRECTVQITNPLQDERVPALLRHSQSDYDKIVQDMPKLYKFGYEASDASVPSAVVESALTVMLFEVMRDLIRQYKPDAIVTTYPLYQASLRAVYSIGRFHVPLITVVTDLVTVHRLWFHEVADYCLVPTQAARNLALSAGLVPHKVMVTGIPVHPNIVHERRDKAAIRAELGWQPDLVTVLAVGSKRVTNLAEMLRGLNHSRLPLQLVVVAGGDDVLYRQFERTEWHLCTHLYNFVTDMPTFLRAADCIVCKAGGMIVTEALACGLPLLLIEVLPGQEAGNATYVLEAGAGERAESTIGALEILHHWLDRDGELLAQRAANACRIGRPNAAYEIAERVWVAAQRGPEARRSRRIPGQTKLLQLLSRYGMSGKDKASGESGSP
jgi:1,2-diacylglycerol 3-beta-galactosyltransferase